MTEFFRTTSDPERGYALAALTGALSFPHAKPGLIRTLIAERTDPELFALSYDYVGDLSETVALMWPPKKPPLPGGERSARAVRFEPVRGSQARHASMPAPPHPTSLTLGRPLPNGERRKLWMQAMSNERRPSRT